jgi:hypothetical protein
MSRFVFVMQFLMGGQGAGGARVCSCLRQPCAICVNMVFFIASKIL